MYEKDMEDSFIRTSTAIQVPLALIFDPTLKQEEKIFLMILMSSGIKEGLDCEYFKQNVGIDVSGLSNMIKELHAMGFFKTRKNEDGTLTIVGMNLEERYKHLEFGDDIYDVSSLLYYTKKFDIFSESMRRSCPRYTGKIYQD